jgi:type IV pilus assembly protein PilV
VRTVIAPRSQRGFTMLELLIAATVLAVGMLGIVAVCLHALGSVHRAGQHLQASDRLADLSERMRANRATLGHYLCALPCTPDMSDTSPAGMDLRSWRDELAQDWPDVQAAIGCVGSAPIRCRIELHWPTRDGSDGATQALELRL